MPSCASARGLLCGNGSRTWTGRCSPEAGGCAPGLVYSLTKSSSAPCTSTLWEDVASLIFNSFALASLASCPCLTCRVRVNRRVLMMLQKYVPMSAGGMPEFVGMIIMFCLVGGLLYGWTQSQKCWEPRLLCTPFVPLLPQPHVPLLAFALNLRSKA